MKRNTVIVLTAALVIGLSTFSYAKYVSGFKVVEVANKQVTIQKGNAEQIMVTVNKANKYKVGDKVKYDAEKLKIRRAAAKKNYEMGC